MTTTRSILTDWDATAANNTVVNALPVDGSVTTANQLDDIQRETMAQLARYNDDLGGVNTVGGTATAVTVTAAQAWTAYGSGDGLIGNGTLLTVKMGAAATGAATLNVNSIGAKAIRRQGDTAIQANDWLANGVYVLRYDTSYNTAAGAWVLVNPNAALSVTAAANADVWAASSSTTYIPPSVAVSALVEVTLTDGATVTIDFATGINFVLSTIAGNRTLAAANVASAVGRSGYIRVKQDGTGSRTLDMSGSPWVNAGGTNTTLSTAASAVDLIFYQIYSATAVLLSIQKGVS